MRSSKIRVIEILREKKGDGICCRSSMSRDFKEFPKADDIHQVANSRTPSMATGKKYILRYIRAKPPTMKTKRKS